jgi:uncharacterized phage protein (TIGR02218 family)
VSKTIDAGLLATYQSDAPTIALLVTVTRTDLEVFRWVGLDRNLTVDGDLYTAAPGVQLSSLVSSEGFGVDNAEITILEDADITRADILAGIWNNAEMTIAECDWADASPVANVLKRGQLGVVSPRRGYSVVEFRDLRQAIQGEQATVLQPTCRYSLGDAKCTKNVSGSPFTVSGTLDSVTSQYSVTDAARAEAADYFGEGLFTFNSGLNAGLSKRIKSFASGGVFVFWQQFIYPIDGTETYTARAGCRLRFQEDCITKFANGVNFGGEPNKLNPDSLTAPA